MIASVTLLLFFQLAGEATVRLLGLPVPGPVLGMALLLAALVAVPPLAARLRETAQTLLAHLSLLFVPAGVGVVGHVGRFGTDGAALLAAILLSTALAIVAGVFAFTWTSRLVGLSDA